MNFKRLIRDFKANFIKNLTFILLITLSVLVIVGFNRSMDSYLQCVYQFRETANMEDGHFAVYKPFSKSKLRQLEHTYDMTIEEYKQVDIDLSPNESDNSITLRVMCLDKSINQAGLIEGQLPTSTFEIALDPKFAAAHGYTIDDTITLSHIDYKIVGYAICPDYTYTLEETTDFLNNPASFGVGFVNEIGFNEIEDQAPFLTIYSYLDPHQHSSDFKLYLNDHASLSYFLSASDNARISTVINDVNAPKSIALIIGLLLVMIVAFIISISVKNTIASESQTIGILYSQGFNKTELLSYYLSLPCFLVSVGILIGYPIGVAISEPLLIMADAQYTIPPVTFRDTPFIFFAGIFLPLFVSMLITYITLSSALNKTPLSLLRGQHNSNHISKFEKQFSFKSFSFFKRFRLKDLIRERGSMLSLLIGVFISMFILLTGFFLRGSVIRYINDLTSNFPYDYIYTFKSTSDLNKFSKQGEQLVFNNFKLECRGKLRNVALYGIQPNSNFFNMAEIAELSHNEVLIAPCMTKKFDIQIGDTLMLLDDSKNKKYPIQVVGYCPYDFGQYFYTSVTGYNQILDKHTLSYNSLITSSPLDVDLDKLYSFATKTSMISSTNNLLGMMSFFTGIMIVIGMAVLMIVVYLLINMILEKSSINISMVKIFGYSPKEINRLYLNGNIVFLILGFIPAIPASYYLCKIFFDSVLEEMDKYFDPYISPLSLIFSFILMLLSYFITCYLLKRKINQIALTEALKNRE